MTKKILLIIGIVAVIGIALFFILRDKPQDGGGDFGFSIGDFLPFGSSGEAEPTNDVVPKEDEGDRIPAATNTGSVPRLRKISSEPVAGAVAFNIGTTTYVRFIEKGTGNVYEADSNTTSIKRLTNTTIPKIIRAFWLPNGSGFLAQTLIPETEIVETSFVKLAKNTATSSAENLTPFTTSISKLPTGIVELTIKPDGSKIFYYIINGGSSNWYLSNPDGTQSSVLNTHPLTEWLPTWINGNIVSLQNKSSASTVGYVYNFDIVNKTLKKVGAEGAGLSSVSKNDASSVLTSRGGGTPRLFLFDTKSYATKDVLRNSLADKCVWLTKETMSVYCGVPNQIEPANYPDDWYKGLIATEDSIKKIDLNNSIDYTIVDLVDETDQKIDVVDLKLSTDETHLIFRNKIDGYLWMLRIEE